MQGEKDSLARHPTTQTYPCLSVDLMPLDPEDRNIVKPTWAQEVQGQLPDSFVKLDTSNLDPSSRSFLFFVFFW